MFISTVRIVHNVRLLSSRAADVVNIADAGCVVRFFVKQLVLC